MGDLDQDPVGGDEIIRVEVGVEALGQIGHGVGKLGVEGGAFRGELDGTGAVRSAPGDQTPGFQVAEELGDLREIEAELGLSGEVVVEGGRRFGGAAEGQDAQDDVLGRGSYRCWCG